LASGAMREVEGGALSDERRFPRGKLLSEDFGENVAWWITVKYLHKKILDSAVFVR